MPVRPGPGTGPVTAAPAAAGTRPPHPLDLALLAPAAVTLTMMLWGITARPYWGDEADTVSAVSRSLPQLIRMLGHTDAVHGLYYLLLWPETRVFGAGEVVTRLPSAIAMAAAAYGVASIGRRLSSRRAGLWAGLVFAALPMVTAQGHDARPYAMVVAAAVLASQQAIGVAADPRTRRWVTYGLALVLLGYLELTALVLVAAHALTLLRLGMPARSRYHGAGQSLRGRARQVARSPLARRWLVTMAGVVAAATPVLIWGWRQRHEVAWIRGPSWGDLDYLVIWLALGSATSVLLVGLLAHAGVARAGHPPARRGPAAPVTGLAEVVLDAPATGGGQDGSQPPDGPALAWLAVPWLVIPPLLLMAVSLIVPFYTFRYVVFCLPAVALLAGAGLAALRWSAAIAAAVLIAVLALPSQRTLRAPGGDVRAAIQDLTAMQQPGDAVVFPGGGIPPWYLVYRKAFGRLDNIALAHSGAASGRLYATTVPRPVLMERERTVSRIWVFEVQSSWQNPAGYLAPGYRLMTRLRPGQGLAWLALYQRPRGPGR